MGKKSSQGNRGAFPRVLVVTTEPFGGNTSSSFTLASLFKGWPRACLAQVYIANVPPDFRACSRYWRIPSSIIATRGYRVEAETTETGETLPHNRSHNKYLRLRPEMKRFLAFAVDATPCNPMSESLRHWIDEFRPDLVYSWLGSNRQMASVREICDYRNIPAVPHFMDDWMSSTLATPVARTAQSLTFHRSLRLLLPHCQEGLGISNAMAIEYSSCYGLPMAYATNGVDSELLAQLEAGAGSIARNERIFRIVILGRLEYGRLRLLSDFISACKSITTPNRKLILSVHSNTSMPESFSSDSHMEIEWESALNNSELVALQKETDCILYMDNFDAFTKRYFRLSFSGKIPICLALGRPIITIGPSGLNSVSYLRDCKVGPVVTLADSEKFAEAVRMALSWDYPKRQEFGLRAWEHACREHSSEGYSRRVRELFTRCI